MPDTLQSVLRRDLLTFDRTAARSLVEAANSGDSTMAKTSESFVLSSKRLSNILMSADRSFGDFIVLNSCAGYVGYLFVSERADNSCMRCESLHGQVFSLDELAENSIIPPLHPNCKCKLFAMDAAALAVYNKNRNGFIRQLDLYCDGENLDEGGVYLLAHDTLGGISLRTQMEFPLATITDSENSAPKWYEGIKVWAEKFWTDFSAAADAFFERGESLVTRADETMNENPLLGMALWADALSFGIVSGLYENWQRNYAIWSENPNAYNLVNLYTHGLVEMADGALFSDEPLSFQHVMDIIGTATLLVGAAKLVQGAQSGNLAGAAAGSIDDTLDDIARQNGKVDVILSANDLNAAYLKVNPTHEPPCTPGTRVYRIGYTGDTGFVRVFSNADAMTRGWIMKADDIAGLTAKQIQDKFSIPGELPPTHICDVIVPKGTAIEISSANGILGHNGGGVQYRLIDGYEKTWFVNSKPLN